MCHLLDIRVIHRMQITTKYKTMSDTETTNSDLTLVLLGFKGSGKSATGNTILQEKIFKSGMGTVGTTKKVAFEKMSYNGMNVTIVDTPPLSTTETLTSIKNCLSERQQTTAVYAIVITIGRFTQNENKVISGILTTFRSFMKSRTLFIFTREDELQAFDCIEKDRLELWLDSVPTIRKWIYQYKIPYSAIENTSNEPKIDTIMAAALSMSPLNSKRLERQSVRKFDRVAAVIVLISVVVIIVFVIYSASNRN